MAELIGDNKDNNSLCDPVSGSGTLLVEVGKGLESEELIFSGKRQTGINMH